MYVAAAAAVLAACTPEQREQFSLYEGRGVWLRSEAAHAPPPVPDLAANNATLPGIDRNGDGVRDDVEILIAVRYKDPQQAAALRRLALAVQRTVAVGAAIEDAVVRGRPMAEWDEQAESAMRANIMAGACVAAVFGAYEDPSGSRTQARAAWAAVDEVVRGMLNTEARIGAYEAVERLVEDERTIVKPLEAALNPCR
jgi:hypothetical protein